MTANGDWSQGGLGLTGEVYLVGPDLLMRSPSRLFIEDQDAFVESALAAEPAIPHERAGVVGNAVELTRMLSRRALFRRPDPVMS